MMQRTPPMGWNTWNTFGEEINDRLIREDDWLSELVNSKVNIQIYAIKYLVNIDNINDALYNIRI